MAIDHETQFEIALAIKEMQKTEGWKIVVAAIKERKGVLEQDLHDLQSTLRDQAENGERLETIGARILSTTCELQGVEWVQNHVDALVKKGEGAASKITTE